MTTGGTSRVRDGRRAVVGVSRRAAASRFFTIGVLGIGGFGLALRVVRVFVAGPSELPVGDGFAFHLEANGIATGHGFGTPGGPYFSLVPSAQHPPLFPLLLSISSVFGGRSVLAHQLMCCLFTALGVVAVGYLGRRIAGERVGLIAALIAAVYPPMWSANAFVYSESLFFLTTTLFLLAAYLLWDHRTITSAVIVGVAVGVGTLTRGEAILFLPFVVLPMVVLMSSISRQQRFVLASVVVLAAALVITPWTVRNVIAFERPVVISQDFDSVIAGANCPTTYHGPFLGGWWPACNTLPDPRGDESVRGAVIRGRGVDYALHHAGRWPVVAAARIGRTWMVYLPFQDPVDAGGYYVLRLAIAMFFALLPLAVAGAVILRRAGRLVLPLTSQAVLVTVVAALAYGVPRLRIPWDVAMVALAAVALDALLRAGLDRWRARRLTQAEDREPAPVAFSS